jgi:nitrite reductase/ring-hydroxylating ferredoxin subunit
MSRVRSRLVHAASLVDVRTRGCLAVHLDGHALALFAHVDRIYAVDNRCPHMGFPLDRGTVKDGILTCHWHHARFDLASGGTFDQFAGDVRAFPVEIRDQEVWVDVGADPDPRPYQQARLQDGLERNIPLVLAKGVIALLDAGDDPVVPFRAGVEFGTRYRRPGWGQGLTILACMMNLVPTLSVSDRPRALYHGLSAVSRDSDGQAPRFGIRPLPTLHAEPPAVKRWFRQFVEVRDAEGAERCIVSAVRAGWDHRQMADMLFAAATDHRYIQIGHVLDFTNKAFETLDVAGWEHAEAVLASLVGGYAGADRMEEDNSWRHPVDLVRILEGAFEALPAARGEGRGDRRREWAGRNALIPVLLGTDPQAIADALLDGLREGATEEELAATVSYAAALRIAQFHTSNEFGDWDTALHTFTFANAVHHGLRRVQSEELLRGVFDAAMSVYLDRFLNIPPAHLPEPRAVAEPEAILHDLPGLLDRQQQVTEASGLAAQYLRAGGAPEKLQAMLGTLLLREDRDFHTIQTVEAAFRLFSRLRETPEAPTVLVAAARYLAAHAPTVRAQGQTYQIAHRLHRGERLFEET